MARKNGFEQIKDKLAKEGKPVDEELHAKMVEIMKKGEFDVQVSPHYSIDHFLRMTVELAPILHKMYWTYLFAKGRYRFITSDNPVSYADPTHDPKALHGVGLATRNVEVTFPVTQEMAIFASWDDGGNLYQRATEATVRAINVRTIANARRFVYSSFPDEGFAKLVWEYTGTAPTAKLEVLHKEDRSFLIFKGTALKDQANIKQLAYGSTRR